jgi:hypothetical protein
MDCSCAWGELLAICPQRAASFPKEYTNHGPHSGICRWSNKEATLRVSQVAIVSCVLRVLASLEEISGGGSAVERYELVLG